MPLFNDLLFKIKEQKTIGKYIKEVDLAEDENRCTMIFSKDGDINLSDAIIKLDQDCKDINANIIRLAINSYKKDGIIECYDGTPTSITYYEENKEFR